MSRRLPRAVIVGGSSAVLIYGTVASGSQATKVVATPEQAAHFETKVRPVFASKCLACHGEKEQIAGLRLDKPISAAMAKKVALAVEYNSPTKMPPSGKLSAQDVAAISMWGKAGGPWPAKVTNTVKKQFWAFVPPKPPMLPKVKASAWIKSPIDQFILAKLESKGLKPAPVADKATLIRRATFDLTGLPPTPAEIDAFIADKAPNAFETLIDRLLSTSAYGERWGRHWLDVARFADSNGLDENLVYHNAWRYRDWVIEAVNADMPIDQFFREQVAGDLMPNATDSQVIATGYLTLGGKMLAEDDPQKQELDIIDEQVDTLTKGMLAMTVGCARCHDHKFDPISAKDYYSLAGIFKSTKTMDKFTVVAEWQERPLGPKPLQAKFKQISETIKQKSAVIAKVRAEEKKVLLAKVEADREQYIEVAKALNEARKNQRALKAELTEREGQLPENSLMIEAENFTGGNASKSSGGYGIGIGVIMNGGTYPNTAEYEFSSNAGGPHQLDLRLASAEDRSFRVYVNGQLALPSAGGQKTGGFFPGDQKWAAQGIVVLSKGKNTLKFERDSYFPHIDRIAIIPRPGAVSSLIDYKGRLPEVVAKFAEQLAAGTSPSAELPEDADRLFPVEKASEIKRLQGEIKNLQEARPMIPHAMAVSEASPKNLKVHLRGSYLTLGEEAPRGVPAILAKSHPVAMPKERSGRLELADWIASPKNPLTARVFVNRVWRWRFGKGLVGSVDNFGILGDLPSHPELLDWLALSFANEDKWSLKKLHKRIMLSNTYQMSTKFDKTAANLDPDNQYLWRFNRKRLEAEAIRDSIFFVAGKLDRKMGGTLMNFGPREYVTSTESKETINYNVNRRAVYLPVIRAAVYDVYTAFDFGDPTVMNGDRPSTTVAPQALFMLNAPIVLSATKAQAEILLKTPGLSGEQRVARIFRTCYGRSPLPNETKRSLEYVNKFRAAYQNAKVPNPDLSAWQSLCKSVIASNEFIYVE